MGTVPDSSVQFDSKIDGAGQKDKIFLVIYTISSRLASRLSKIGAILNFCVNRVTTLLKEYRKLFIVTIFFHHFLLLSALKTTFYFNTLIRLA